MIYRRGARACGNLCADMRPRNFPRKNPRSSENRIFKAEIVRRREGKTERTDWEFREKISSAELIEGGKRRRTQLVFDRYDRLDE